MHEHPLVRETSAKMQKSLDHTVSELNAIHTGKASPSMVEGIMVEAYGSHMRLKEVGAITTPDSRMIVIQPWDKSILKAVEKAIQMANIGINPSIDGSIIRLPLPDMSKDRRLELVKVAHRLAEEGRVSIRTVRRDGFDHVKRADLSDDQKRRLEKDIQAHTDRMMKEIGEHLVNKEAELMKI
ncbi:MAG TPA: ribosome recycling factor [Opitutaceae bacterium]|nr:ribosome recycling factor [Opitutaceae bacterium]